MNLELLEEIHILKNDGISDADIASSLGMQKNILLVCLRMEKLISDKYENIINENSSLIHNLQLLKDKNKTLQNENKALTEDIKTYKSLNEVKQLQNISDLKNSLKNLKIEYYELFKKYESIPEFVKKFF